MQLRLQVDVDQLSIRMLSALNLDFDEWDQAFATNRLLAAATLDRLRHNAYCLELNGRSYRDPKVPPASKTAPSTKAQNQAK